MNLRAHAARCLAPIIKAEQSLQSGFDPAANAVNDKDRALFHELVYGCLRHYEWLLAAYNQLVSKRLKNKDTDVKALILLGLYQIQFLRTPDHAAISETVSGASALKKHWAKGFVNGVLRNYLREQEQIVAQLHSIPSATYACPEWLLTQIRFDWPNTWQNILANTAEKPPITLRNNQRRQTRDQLANALAEQNIETRPTHNSQQGLSLTQSSSIQQLEAIKNGQVSVQDEAAQLAAVLLDAQSGEHILDACAAPGGKTCHLLEHTADIHVTALELDRERSLSISENLERLKLNAKLIVADAMDIDSWWDGKPFDRILLDAPCSATGVIRRHPDIKLLRRQDDLAKLAEIQSAILEAMWQCLAVGGTLVYATCSILKQENEDIVSHFLAQHNNAKQHIIDAEWGESRPAGRQLFPKEGAHDGFYYAKLVKNSP